MESNNGLVKTRYFNQIKFSNRIEKIKILNNTIIDFGYIK